MSDKLLSKCINKFWLLFDSFYNDGPITSSQIDALYSSLNLNRDGGLELLDTIIHEVFGSKYSEFDGMFSEHLVLLSSLAYLNQNKKFNILEIGTFDGKTALLLSRLFPHSIINTIDLGAADGFADIYNRSDSRDSFIQNRDITLSLSSNIKFTEMSSVALTLSHDTYDLIWIDGAHGYPVVAFDIVNARRLIRHDGWVLIDDIYISKDIASDSFYKSVGGYQCLQALVDAELISNFSLIPKRLSANFNTKRAKKFIGVFRG